MDAKSSGQHGGLPGAASQGSDVRTFNATRGQCDLCTSRKETDGRMVRFGISYIWQSDRDHVRV